MEILHVDSNVVLLLNNPDLRFIDQMWLVEKGVCDREDFKEENNLFMPELKQITTSTYHLVMMRERLVLHAHGTPDEREKTFQSKLMPIFKEQTHLRIAGMGINTKVFVSPKEGFADFNKNVFFKSDSPLSPYFKTPDSRYGAYMSTDYEGLRLKLTIRPVSVSSDASSEEKMDFEFNYHSPRISNDSADGLMNVLAKWRNCHDHSCSIIQSLEG